MELGVNFGTVSSS